MRSLLILPLMLVPSYLVLAASFLWPVQTSPSHSATEVVTPDDASPHVVTQSVEPPLAAPKFDEPKFVTVPAFSSTTFPQSAQTWPPQSQPQFRPNQSNLGCSGTPLTRMMFYRRGIR